MEVTGKSENQVVEDICVVHGFFGEMAREDLGHTLAGDNMAILTSSRQLQKRIAKALGSAAPLQRHSGILGVDLSCGQVRAGSGSKNTKRANRWLRARRRYNKLLCS